MTQQMQQNARPEVVDDPCPRCGAGSVRVIIYGPLDFAVEAVDRGAGVGAGAGFGVDDAPIFDCGECGFEWGLAVRDLLA